jgi:PKD repeat protein
VTHPARPIFIRSLNSSYRHALRGLLIVVASFAVTACGGGGGGGDDGTNVPPTARINASPTCGAAPMAVSFDAGGSLDPDGGIVSYNWIFGDGGTATGAAVSHTYTGGGAFTATLTVTDTDGARSTASVVIATVTGPLPTSVAVNGTVSFERVPFSNTLGDGLDYNRTFAAPAREVEVSLIRAADGAVLQTAVTNALGQYSLAAPINTNVFVRAKALSRPAAAQPATWNLRVLDNTSSNALYVLDGSAFYSCVVNQTRNLTATTGWGGGLSGVYNGPRAAAPFAVLDTLYSAAQFVIAEGDASVQLPALAAYWSEDNVPADGDIALGQIGTTSYVPTGQGVPSGIYVLGDAGHDTDEFDQHVVAHEFQHYLEDVLSRSDTIGGPHSLDERLDMRVAFSEGFANAFSGMVLDDPVYRDSFGSSQGDDFFFDMENRQTTAPGWYSEDSVQRIAWDLFDTSNDDADAVAIGYGPMYGVFTDELRTGVPLGSLFSFNTALKTRPGIPVAQVNTLVEAQGVPGTSLGIVSTTMNAYATTETHSGVSAASADLVLPVYTQLAVPGTTRLCSSSSIETADGTLTGAYNKLGNRRFVRFSLPAATTLDVTVSCPSSDATCAGSPVPDPDFVLTQASTRVYAESGDPRVEILDNYAAAAGDYVLEVYEFSHVNLFETNPRGRTCLTVTLQ